jgi:mannitol-1-phosphate/altronate dehydrogenase
MQQTKLPLVKKKVDSKKFETLAKKVRKYFEEENKYIKDRNESYGYNKTTRLTTSS